MKKNKISVIPRPDSPIYVNTLVYWGLILLLTATDAITVNTLFDTLLNGNKTNSFIITLSITIVLDVYSILLPSAVSYLSTKKQYICFGIGLAVIIILVYITYLRLRLMTNDALGSDDVYILSNSASTSLALLLALVPLASTFFSFYLSLIKNNWDKKSQLFTIDELIRVAETKIHELEESQNKTVHLGFIDNGKYIAVAEEMKATVQELKITARLEFAKSIGSADAIRGMTVNKGIIPESIITEMQSRPIDEPDNNINISSKTVDLTKAKLEKEGV